MRKLFLHLKRWFRTVLYLKKWRPSQKQVVPKEVEQGITLRKFKNTEE
tara:strand:+ start:81 stop:224 length:144 start_codon:yes stop_codon:yes gene_type:complete